MDDPRVNGFWKQLLVAMIIPMAVALVTFGALASRVSNIESQLSDKATRETVQAEYESLLREIQALRADVQSIKRP